MCQRKGEGSKHVPSTGPLGASLRDSFCQRDASAQFECYSINDVLVTHTLAVECAILVAGSRGMAPPSRSAFNTPDTSGVIVILTIFRGNTAVLGHSFQHQLTKVKPN